MLKIDPLWTHPLPHPPPSTEFSALFFYFEHLPYWDQKSKPYKRMDDIPPFRLWFYSIDSMGQCTGWMESTLKKMSVWSGVWYVVNSWYSIWFWMSWDHQGSSVADCDSNISNELFYSWMSLPCRLCVAHWSSGDKAWWKLHSQGAIDSQVMSAEWHLQLRANKIDDTPCLSDGPYLKCCLVIYLL